MPTRTSLAETVNDLLLPIVKGVGSRAGVGDARCSRCRPSAARATCRTTRSSSTSATRRSTPCTRAPPRSSRWTCFFRKIVRDHGRALGHVAEQIAAFLDEEGGNGRLKEERALLATALADVRGDARHAHRPRRLGRTRAAPASPGRPARVRLLMALGDLLVGLAAAAPGQVALEVLDAGTAARPGLLRGQDRRRPVFSATAAPTERSKQQQNHVSPDLHSPASVTSARLEHGLLRDGPMNTAERVQEGSGAGRGAARRSGARAEPRRIDWLAARAALDKVQSLLQTSVLGPLAACGSHDGLAGQAADAAAAVAAVLHASGDMRGASALFERAAALATDARQKAGFIAALREPSMFVLLAHAAWLDGRGRAGDGLRASRAGGQPGGRSRPARGRRRGAARRRARRGRTGRRAAPWMWTLNGCGFRLYGARDRRPDGSAIATYFLTFLFIPVLPIRAYRVLRDGDAYWFHSKAPLSALNIWFRRLMLTAVIGLVCAGSYSSWQASPGRRAGKALAAASASEQRGEREAAEKAYQGAIDDFFGKVDDEDLEPAAVGLVRLALAEVKEPFTPAQLDTARRVVARYDGLPSLLRTGPARQLLVDRLVGWAAIPDDAATAQIQTSLSLLELAERVGGRSDLADRRAGLRRRLAASYEASEPMAALALHLEQPADAASREAAGKLISGILDQPSLLLELEEPLLAWAEKVGQAGEAVAAAVSAARPSKTIPAACSSWKAATPRCLGKAVAAAPRDQLLVCALAETRAAAGDTAGARQLIEGLGPPGRLVGRARTLLAQLRRDPGNLAGAADILESWLAWRKPMYQAAANRYSDHRRALGEQLEGEMKRGEHNAELEPLMKDKGEDEQQEAFMTWVGARMDSDSQLNALGNALGRHAAIAPAALLAGQIALERARAAEGDEAERLLAAAEQHYLSIQLIAAGSFDYQLGLGQVYYRLGRPADGDKEFDALLAEEQPMATLAVASTYRELGVGDRARALAETRGQRPGGERRAAGQRRDAGRAPRHQPRRAGHLAAPRRHARGEEHAPADRGRRGRRGRQGTRGRGQAGRGRGLAPEGRRSGRFLAQQRGPRRPAPLPGHRQARAPGSRGQAAGEGGRPQPRQRPRGREPRRRLAPARPPARPRRAHRAAAPPPRHEEADAVCTALENGPEGDAVRDALRRDPSVRRALELYARLQLLSPQNPSGYLEESDLHGELRDVAARQALAERVGRLSGFAVGERVEVTRAYVAGEKDADIRKAYDAEIGHAGADPRRPARERAPVDPRGRRAEPLGRAGREGPPRRPRGAAGGERSSRQGARAVAGPGHRRPPGLARASALDPRGGRRRRLQGELHRAEPPVRPLPGQLAARRRARRRGLRRRAARPPRAGRAVAGRSPPIPTPSLETWIIARLAGDAALEKLAETQLTTPLVQARYAVLGKVLAGVPGADREVALYNQRK